MTASLFLRQLAREARGSRGRLAFFAACLGVGVAAVVAVGGFSSAVDSGIRRQARSLLAADVSVESLQPIPATLDAALRDLPGVARVDVTELITVVSAPPAADGSPGRSQLVELKAVDPGYPFYGALETDPPLPLAGLLGTDGVVVAPELLPRLGLARGGTLSIGGQPFRITATLLAEPDRIAGSFSLGPRILVGRAGLARTPLTGFGSRVTRKALLKLPGAPDSARLTAVATRLKEALGHPAEIRVETATDAQPALRRAVARVDRFLGLVALLSLLVGGVGISQTVRAWIASRLDSIAILRCLGMRPREVLALYLGQTALLAAAGSLAGAAAGLLILATVPRLFADMIPGGGVDAWQPLAALRGVGLGVGVALLFSVAPLAGVRRVPPARVLRRDAEPLPPSRGVRLLAAVLLLAGTVAVAAVQARSLLLGSLFAGGLVAAAGALSLAALALLAAASRVPRSRVPFQVRSALAALGRPGAGTAGSVVAIGLGLLVVVALALVQGQLARDLAAELPRNAPTAFLLDVQPDQWDGIRRLLAREGATRIDSVPVVMARLTAVDGRDAETLAASLTGETAERRRWALTREQRLTYMDGLPPDNRVVAGRLWKDPDPEVSEVSVEERFARENLGVGVGSHLDFDVQGVPLRLKVTSLRTVDWRTFGINFFFVVEPGVLDAAPQTRLAAARLPRGKEDAVQDLLAKSWPNVSVIRTREILEKIAGVIDRLAGAVNALGGFTVLAGLAILAGAVSAGTARRAREVALLKTLGVTRAGVAGMLALEYLLVGLAAGLVGTAGGALLSWAVVRHGFDVPWAPSAAVIAAGPLVAALLTAGAGLAASVPALRRRPLETLRAE